MDGEDDVFDTVAAESPVAAAMELFFLLRKTWPEVVEVIRTDLVGYPLTTVRLAAAHSEDVVEIEVEDRTMNC
jgi:hypothetical protein